MNKIELQNRTKAFAVRIFKMVDKLPLSSGTKVISYQILKSSSSIAANYRAACRGKSKADFINKIKIVEEESDETLFWLEFIVELNLVSPNQMNDLIKESKELLAIFTSALKTSKEKYTNQIP